MLYNAIREPRWRLAIGLLGRFGLRLAELGCCRVYEAVLRVERVKRNSSDCLPAHLVHGLDPTGAGAWPMLFWRSFARLVSRR